MNKPATDTFGGEYTKQSVMERFDEWWKNKGCLTDDEIEVDKGKVWVFISNLLKEQREECKPFLEALVKIDKAVSTDGGFEADCYLGLDEPRGEQPNSDTAKEWAKLIMEVYKIIHPLCHDCCGVKGKTVASLLEKQEE